MNNKAKIRCVAKAAIVLLICAATVSANEKQKPSNIGLKLAVGVGNQNPSNSQNLDQGESVAISLGYGVSEHVSLWASVQGGEHVDLDFRDRTSTVAGIELNLQYKLRPHEKLRPYGRVGVGGFVREDEPTKVTYTGGGITWALGGEYRLARFITIGAEFFWKDFDYERQKIGEDGDFFDLDRPLHGNTNGFMVVFTIH